MFAVARAMRRTGTDGVARAVEGESAVVFAVDDIVVLTCYVFVNWA